MFVFMKELEKQLKAMGNNRRLSILAYLKKNKQAIVGDIAEHIALSIRSTSRHLRVLYAAEILSRYQVNLNVFYALNKDNSFIVKQVLSLL